MGVAEKTSYNDNTVSFYAFKKVFLSGYICIVLVTIYIKTIKATYLKIRLLKKLRSKL